MFESVDLPAPFSPSSACTSPSSASKSTASFATTPGNRFVIPRSVTAAGMKGGVGSTEPQKPAGGADDRPARVDASALRAPDDALDEVAHRVEIVERGAVPRLDAELPGLVVDRAAELVPL